MNDTRYVVAAATLAVAYFAIRAIRDRRTIQQIPGPPCSSWVFGHLRELFLAPTYGEYEFQWLRQYGAVYRIQGCFGADRLLISDPAALNFIATSGHFVFGPSYHNLLRLLYQPESVILTDDEEHKRMRAILNPGFSTGSVRNYISIFERAAQTLTEQLEERSGEVTNVAPLFGHATIGTTSEAILGHRVEELGAEFIVNNLEIISLAANQSATQILLDAVAACIPAVIRDAAIHLPVSPFTALKSSRILAERLGKKVVEEKLNAVRQGIEGSGGFYGELVEARQSKQANSLCEKEIIAQTSLMLIVGQETTAMTLAFGLAELAQNIEFQNQLRAEIYSHAGVQSAEDIAYDNMPLLNAFIKESLRMYPAQPIPERMATEDTVLPLAESIRTRDGEQINKLPIRKGQIMLFSIASYQRLGSRWGPDPNKFNPLRWLEDGGVQLKGEAIGPYGSLLSFLGGPRTCLGWRFAIVELQVFICELVGKFEFSLPPEGPARCRYGGTLMPVLPDGRKGALLSIKRVT
ncbi:cytochrome P450 [Favolaschia claudopus]|uniref:Cytochrome P450 n=1 Tax=Favolaschia claudopus TaxID=2862362 RepID=A0AAV9ZFM7_9AGAR